MATAVAAARWRRRSGGFEASVPAPPGASKCRGGRPAPSCPAGPGGPSRAAGPGAEDLHFPGARGRGGSGRRPPSGLWYVPDYGVRARPQGLGGAVRVSRVRTTESGAAADGARRYRACPGARPRPPRGAGAGPEPAGPQGTGVDSAPRLSPSRAAATSGGATPRRGGGLGAATGGSSRRPSWPGPERGPRPQPLPGPGVPVAEFWALLGAPRPHGPGPGQNSRPPALAPLTAPARRPQGPDTAWLPWQAQSSSAAAWRAAACRPSSTSCSPSTCSSGWEDAASWGWASGWPPRRGTSPPCPPPSRPCRPPTCSSSPAPSSWPSASWAALGPSRRTSACCSRSSCCCCWCSCWRSPSPSSSPPTPTRYAQRDLKKGLHLYGTPGNVGLTNAWSIIQTDFRCCGVSNYTDWFEVYNATRVPDSCCLEFSESCGLHAPGTWWKAPCYETVKMWLQENLLAVGIFGLCTALVQILGLTFAMTMYCQVVKADTYCA